MIAALLFLVSGLALLSMLCCLGLLTLRRLVAKPTQIYYQQYRIMEQVKCRQLYQK